MQEQAKIHKIKHHDGKTMVYASIDKIITEQEFLKYRNVNTGYIDVDLSFFDKNQRTQEQNKIMHCLFREIAVWSCGYDTPKEELEYKNYMKQQYSDKPFKTSEMNVKEASDFIAFIIEFCFQAGVPFRDKGINMTDDINKYLFLCLKYRKCAVTGVKGEVHHIDTIGAGRDRRHVDHSQHRLVCLSREMHTKAHTMGWEDFASLHHIDGVKLTKEQVKEIKYK